MITPKKSGALRHALCCLAALALGSSLLPAEQLHKFSIPFQGTTSHYYRIPSIVATKNIDPTKSGKLVAIVEDRIGSADDSTQINIVCKTSTNDGLTWSDSIPVIGVGPNSWTNPTAVYIPPASNLPSINSRTYGRIILFCNWNEAGIYPSNCPVGGRKTYSCFSDDQGSTWSTPVLRTELMDPDRAWDSVGPGTGICMQVTQSDGSTITRIVFPASNRNFYSDDFGTNWTMQWIPKGTGEATIVETSTGQLMRNDRATKGTWDNGDTYHYRQVSLQNADGSFPAFQPDDHLPDPKCEGSILRYNFTSPDRIIFLNSRSTEDSDLNKDHRRHMYIRISYNDGSSWYFRRFLYCDGKDPYGITTETEAITYKYGGYSSMAKTSNPDYPLGVAILVEHSTDGKCTVAFHKVNLEWIRNSVAEPTE